MHQLFQAVFSDVSLNTMMLRQTISTFLGVTIASLTSFPFFQVKTIRDGLRKLGLGAVDVETIENVQGWVERAFS